jgi:hypothetical protein
MPETKPMTLRVHFKATWASAAVLSVIGLRPGSA